MMAAAIRAKSNAKRRETTKHLAGPGALSFHLLTFLLNPYLVGVLSSMAIQPSYRSYRARSTSATLNDFGTTIGSGAGVNVFHAFEPDIRHIVGGLTSKFVSRMKEHATRSLTSTNVIAIAP